MKVKPLYVFVTLCVLFFSYSAAIYFQPIRMGHPDSYDVERAAEGRLVFQKYNCQACHQLYGLGGHLGPDLTNEYSKLNGNEAALRVYFKGGMKQMPVFNLSTEEEDLLIEFLKSTDASGIADPRNLEVQTSGMTKHKNGK